MANRIFPFVAVLLLWLVTPAVARTGNDGLAGVANRDQRSARDAALHGVVESVDQASDTIRVRLSGGSAVVLRVQDGLVFDAVRQGDLVDLTVRNFAGQQTIVALTTF